jgi:hypothetical protein
VRNETFCSTRLLAPDLECGAEAVGDFDRIIRRNLAHFRLDKRAKNGVGHFWPRIDRPGVSFDAEVEQARDQGKALRLCRHHGIETQIGERHAGPSPLHMAEETFRIARQTPLSRRRQHRVVAEARPGYCSDKAAHLIKMMRSNDDGILQSCDGIGRVCNS